MPGKDVYNAVSDFWSADEREMESMQVQEPSSHRLAVSLGVSARNMQVMKASFFTEEDETDAEMGKYCLLLISLYAKFFFYIFGFIYIDNCTTCTSMLRNRKMIISAWVDLGLF